MIFDSGAAESARPRIEESMPESLVERKSRLKSIILKENSALDLKDQFSGFGIKQALDLPVGLLRDFIRQIESKTEKKPGEIKELRLYRFVLSGDSAELRPPAIEPETPAEIVVASDYSDTDVSDIVERNRTREVKEIRERLASTPEIIEKPPEAWSNSGRQTFEPVDLDSGRVVIEKVQGQAKENPPVIVAPKTEVLTKVDEPATPEIVASKKESEAEVENGPLFSVGGEVFWQGKKLKIMDVSIDGKYKLGRKSVFGFGKKEVVEVPGKELEKVQLERAKEAPAEVVKLFRSGQELKFVMDDGRLARFKINSRVGESSFFGALSIRNADGTEEERGLEKINASALCRYLLGETTTAPDLKFTGPLLSFPDKPKE